MIFPLFATISLASASLAQMTHNVTVGAGGALAFSPDSISAAIGDTVQFLFEAKNHTATQSSFDSPCSRLIGADGVSVTGFDSGFQPVDAAGDVRISSFKVTSSDPLWFYCRQTGHCGQGMVFAVNAPTTGNTFDQFLSNALATGSSLTSSVSSAPPSTATTSTTSASSSTTSTMVTITTPAPPVSVVTVTQTVTLGSSTWTTTYGSYPGSADPTPNPEPVVHTVKVGENGALTFNPSNITAQPRDIVMFEFLAKNHTATQSTFTNPCVPIGSNGFDSGFKPVTTGDLVPQLFNITVSDTAPVWVYCKQTNPSSHCGAGMVFSVNAVESSANNFAAFQANAERLNGTSTTTTSTTSSSGAAKRSLSVGNNVGALVGIGMTIAVAMIGGVLL